MEFIHKVLDEELKKQESAVYLDDVLLYHEMQLKNRATNIRLLEQFDHWGLKLSWKKCQIETTKVDFLGFTFSKELHIPQDSKIKAIQEWETPTKLKELQSFLGFINFYQTFIPNHAEIT